MDVSHARDNHAALHAGFGWEVPEHFNIAEACCGRWARRPDAGERVAVIAHGTGATRGASARKRSGASLPGRPGADRVLTFAALQEQANRLANLLATLDVGRGDRVAIVMPQRFETAVAYMAVFQLGAVAMPLSMLFGPEALEYRLQDSGAVVALCDDSSIANLQEVRGRCPALRTVIGVGAAEADVAYAASLAAQASTHEAVATKAGEGAVLIYTSGTTGPPKGALIPHQALLGNLPGFVCSQNWFGYEPAAPSQAPLDPVMPAQAGTHGSHKPVMPAKAGIQAASAGGAQAAWTPASTGVAVPRGQAAPGAAARDRPEASLGATDLPEPTIPTVFWSPADWAWTGGLMDALLPSLYFGRPIVAWNGRFSPELAFTLLREHKVTHSFLFPTALKAMMKAFPQPRRQFTLHLRGLMSAGEAVGDAVFAWCREELGVTVNEMFGQTEMNYVVGNCAMEWSEAAGGDPVPHRAATGWPARPGSMGRPYPGHRVAVIDDEGKECPTGVPGDVAVNRYDMHGRPDPIFFLGYWRNAGATQRKYTGDWCRTGDLATRDADGYLWYQGRADDVFKAAGYRIGPSEIENCLIKHPAVANAAVVPKPDAERGALVKAYVVLAPDAIATRRSTDAGDFDARLVAELQAHVRGKLAPYEYPKEIEFIDALPMTTTGKVQRRVLRLQEEERARAA